MKQPVLGIVSSILVFTVSLGFISLFSLSAFTTWVAYGMICLIPMITVISVTWGVKHPAWAAKHAQPVKGILFVLIVAAIGALVAAAHFLTVGGTVSPPAPMLSMCIVTTVIVSFWFSIVWGGWPFSVMLKNSVAAGLAMLAAGYVVNYLLFRLFFNFQFMQGDPGYLPSLDPHGLFNAWSAQVSYITIISAMFLVLNFDTWPLSKRPALMRQPLLGVVWTAIIIGIGAFVFFIGVGLFRMDPPVFMVRVPIPFIFGTILVKNMMQDALFARFSQPLKGLCSTATAAVAGVALSRAFGALAHLVSGPVASGAPGYGFELWLASALLAVTFPFMIIFAELFQFWPLQIWRKGEARKSAS